MKKVYPRKCLNCKEKFIPVNQTNTVCSTKCAIEYSKAAQKKKKENEWKKEKAVLKDKLKTKSDYEKELQKEINTIVRLIDKGFVCISTKKPLNDKYDAGHFYSVGSNPTIRFNLFNIYAQSVYANQYLSGDQINFLDGLRHYYGNEHAEYVLRLKSEFKVLKLSIEEIKEKISISRSIVKWLKLQDRVFTTDERLELRIRFNYELGIYGKETN